MLKATLEIPVFLPTLENLGKAMFLRGEMAPDMRPILLPEMHPLPHRQLLLEPPPPAAGGCLPETTSHLK